MLRFQTEPAVIEVVASVELDARLVRAKCHHAAGFRVFDAGSFDERFSAVVDDEVVVVAVELGFELVDAFTDARWFGEIERCAFHAGEFAGGDEAIICGSIVRRPDIKFVIENVAVAREVEVGVVGEIDDGGFVGGGFVIDTKFVFVGEGVGDLCRKCAGIIFFAIFADVSELHGRFAALCGKRFSFPKFARETGTSAMEMIFAVVRGEFVFDAIEREFGVGDAIRKPPDHRGGTREAVEVFVERFCAEDDIGGASLAIEREEFCDDRALLHDARDHAVAVAEGENLDGRSVLEFAEFRFFNAREGGCRAGGAESERDQEQEQEFENRHGATLPEEGGK